MTLADVLVRLERAELSLLQFRAYSANGSSSRGLLGKSHEQTVRKLIAVLVFVNVRHNHFGCAGLIKFLHEVCRIAFFFEASERMSTLTIAVLLQPVSRIASMPFSQKPLRKDAMGVLLCRAIAAQQFSRPSGEFRECFVFCRSFTICLRADNATVQINFIREQRPVEQPDAVSSAELAAQGGDFDLKLPVVMPAPLHARPVVHSVFAEQSSGLVPLAADPMKRTVLEMFFRSEHAVFVPSADDTMPLAIPQRNFLVELTVPIKASLKRRFHHALRRCVSVIQVLGIIQGSTKLKRQIGFSSRSRFIGSCRTAKTDSRDENLKAKPEAAAGGSRRNGSH